MVPSTLLRVCVSSLVVLAAAVGVTGCVAGSGGATTSPSATAGSTPSPSATPTKTPTSTPKPTTPAPTATPSAPAVATVSVQILNAAYDPSSSSIAVAGMVTDLVSDSGVCTATATQADKTVTAQAPGMADAAVTYCSNLSIALPAGSSGSWNVTLDFADATHSGTATTTVQAG